MELKKVEEKKRKEKKKKKETMHMWNFKDSMNIIIEKGGRPDL